MRRISVYLVVLGVLLGVFLTLVWQEPSPPRQAQRLPDGTPLTLVGTTFGTEHHLAERAPRRGWLLRLIQPSEADESGFTVRQQSTTDRKALVFWLARPGSGDWLAAGLLGNRLRAVTVDEHGCEWRHEYMMEGTSHRWAGSHFYDPQNREVPWQPVMPLTVPVFPRRDEQVRLRLYQMASSQAWVPVAEFTAPNPAPASGPGGQPERLPVRRRLGDAWVTLTRLLTGVGETDRTQRARPGERQLTLLTFHIQEKLRGEVTYPSAVHLADSAGNSQRLAPSNIRQVWEPQRDLTCQIPGALCPEEVWTLGVEFAARGTGGQKGRIAEFRVRPTQPLHGSPQ